MSTGVDAVVVGGGPAGAVAALTLARAGRRVLLAERRSAEPFKIGEALLGAARPLLRDLGVWDQFVADGHLPSYGVSAAWGTSAPLDTDFIHDPNGHGWHVDRSRFEAFLRTAGVRRRRRVARRRRRSGSRAPSCAWTVRAVGACVRGC